MKRLPMRKIRDVIRLSAEGLSTRQMAASLAIGRTTLQGYLERAQEAGLSVSGGWTARCSAGSGLRVDTHHMMGSSLGYGISDCVSQFARG